MTSTQVNLNYVQNNSCNKPGVCRVCMKNNNTEMNELFGSDCTIVNKIQYCTGIHFTEYPTVPSLICTECLSQLETAHNFKKTCIKAEKVFEELVNPEMSFVDEIGAEVEVMEEYPEITKALSPVQKVSLESMKPAVVVRHNSKSKYPALKVKSQDSTFVKLKVLRVVDGLHIMTKNLETQIFQHKKSVDKSIEQNYVSEPSHEEEPSYECAHCSYTTKVKTGIKRHLHYYHTDGKMYQCDKCPETFRSSSDRQAHIRRKHGGKKIPCDSCDMEFYDVHTLRQHNTVVHDKLQRFVCSVCKKDFIFETTWAKHMFCEHGVIVKQDSYRASSNKSTLSSNRSKKFLDNGIRRMPRIAKTPLIEKDLNLQCMKCSLKFQTIEESIEHHRELHNGSKFVCGICGKECTYLNYRRHVQRVHGEGPRYECAHCSYSTTNKGDLRLHLYIHSGELNYQCDKCSQRCRTSSNLQQHIRSKHEPKKNICDRCHKAFCDPYKLKQHVIRVHDRIKRYFCSVCKMGFICRLTWKKHLFREHSVIVPPGKKGPVSGRAISEQSTLLTNENKNMEGISTEMSSTQLNLSNGQHDSCNKPGMHTAETAFKELVKPQISQEICSDDEIVSDIVEDMEENEEVSKAPSPVSSESITHAMVARKKISQDSTSVKLKVLRVVDGIHIMTKNSKTQIVQHKKSIEESIEQHDVCEPSHEEGPSYECAHCSYTTKTKRSLRRHLRSHHTDEKKYQCDKCPETFRSSSDRQAHIRRKHGGKKIPCDSCDMEFYDVHTLRQHNRAVHDELQRYVCSVCKKDFIFETTWAKHMFCEHGVIVKQDSYRASSKKSTLSSNGSKKILDNGIRRMPNKAKTPFIEKDLNLQCIKCSTKFQTIEESIEHHRELHNGSKFVCGICGKECTYLNYRRHVKSMHGGGPLYECAHCSYSTKYKGTLKTHLYIHSGEKKYQCDKCSQRCRTSSALLAHIRCNHGPKKYFCDRCSTSFFEASKLKQHVLTIHDKIKRFVCSVCKMSFVFRVTWKSHMFRKHGVIVPPGKMGPMGHWASSEQSTLLTNGNKNMDGVSAEMSRTQLKDMEENEDFKTKNPAPNTKSQLMNDINFETQDPISKTLKLKVLRIGEGIRIKLKNLETPKVKYFSFRARRCMRCDIKFQTKKESIEHYKTVHNIFKNKRVCEICGKQCSNENYLQHMRRMHGEGPTYECAHCSYTTKAKEDLKTHISIHTDDKKYPCDKCSMKFRTSSNRQAHIRRMHGGKKIPCDRCNTTFFDKYMLRRHTMAVHDKIKQHVCSVCKRAFSTRRDWKRHLHSQHAVIVPLEKSGRRRESSKQSKSALFTN